MSRFIFTIVLILLMLGGVTAGTIKVPADYTTIQAGIDATVNGDTVLVGDSTYYENINFKGKAITVASYYLMDGDTTHINNTIIDGSRSSDPNKGSVVSFTSGEDTTSVICGFTITGGTGTLYDSQTRVGGGVYCISSGARIAHNKIVHNSLTHNQNCWGGGIGTWPIENRRHVVIEDNVVESNSLHAGNQACGGGIFLQQGRIVFNKINSNSIYAQASFARGGGISADCGRSANRTLIKVHNNKITNNQAIFDTYPLHTRGGGIDNFWCNIELVANIITYNLVSGSEIPLGSGATIWGVQDSVMVKDNTISFNSFINGFCKGGGLMVGDSDLSENPAKVTITGNRFEGNKACRGGGLHIPHNPGCVISNNEFIANVATEWGGGINDYDSNPLTISNNVFIKNQATHCGGGLSTRDSDVLIVNNIFIGNESRWAGGINIWQWDHGLTFVAQIINNTITANVADSAGGIGIWDHHKVALMNNICWANDASFAPEILVRGGELDIAYSDIRFGVDSIKVTEGATLNWLTGNINKDPQFVPGDTLYHLTALPSNPCVNSGIYFLLMGGYMYYCPLNDYDGNRRPFPGTLPDMGAYETDIPGIIAGIEQNAIVEIPNSYALHQNYPNPFNPTTTIEFALPKPAFVTLKVYNLLGEEVAALVAEQRSAGIHKLNWDASGLASGVYLYRLEACDPSSRNSSVGSGQRLSTSISRTESKGFPNKSGQGFVQSKRLTLIR